MYYAWVWLGDAALYSLPGVTYLIHCLGRVASTIPRIPRRTSLLYFVSFFAQQLQIDAASPLYVLAPVGGVSLTADDLSSPLYQGIKTVEGSG